MSRAIVFDTDRSSKASKAERPDATAEGPRKSDHIIKHCMSIG
jgi:hypothetical protein